MGDRLPVFKAAAVQAAPVYLDREASVKKACSLIEEAGKNGAQLIVLPEVFIPGGPYWAWHLPMTQGMRFSVELYENSVEIPSDSTARLGEAAFRAPECIEFGGVLVGHALIACEHHSFVVLKPLDLEQPAFPLGGPAALVGGVRRSNHHALVTGGDALFFIGGEFGGVEDFHRQHFCDPV